MRKSRFLTPFAVLMCSLAACSSVTNGTGSLPGQQPSGPSASPTGSSDGLSIRWRAKVGGGIGPDQLAGGSADAHHVYVSSDSGQVTGLDARTGKVLWRSQPGTRSGVGVGNAAGVVFYYDSNIGVVAVDGNTGRVLWKGGPNGGNSGGETFQPAYADGVVALTSEDGVAGLDLHTGRRRWGLTSFDYEYNLEPPVAADGLLFGMRQTLDGNSSPSIIGISAATGRVNWSAPLPGVSRQAINTLVPAGTDVVVASRFSAEGPTTLFDFDARTHVHRWTASVPGLEAEIDNPGVDGRTLIWPTLQGMRGVSLDTGKALFTRPADGSGSTTSVGDCGGHICAVGIQVVTVIDATGKVVGHVTPPTTPNDETAKPMLDSAGHTYLFNASYVYGLD